MYFLHDLLAKLRPLLMPLEKKLLQEFGARLEPNARELLQRQISQINLIQRHSNSKQVCFYSIRSGIPYWDPTAIFPARSLELRLATLRFRVPGNVAVWCVDVILVEGHLFSLVFEPSPKGIAKREDIEVEHMILHQDPMQRVREAVTQRVEAGELRLVGWLEDCRRRFELAEVYLPLPEEERSRLTALIRARLPDEYTQLVEQCEGLAVDGCVVFGLSQVYEVTLDKANYYLLADIEGHGALAVRSYSDDELIYYLDYDGAEPRVSGRSFRAAMEAQLRANS